VKVLQIVSKPQRRGAETFAFELSEALVERGVEVRTIYLYQHKGDKSLPLKQYDVVLAGDETHILERWPGLRPKLVAGVVRGIRAFEPDIVQVNGSRTVKYGAAAKRLAGKEARWKLIYRNIDVPSFWNRRRSTIAAYRWVFMPLVDGVVGVSRECLRDAMDLYRFRVPAELIYNGIDPRKLQLAVPRTESGVRRGAASGDIVMLFVGSLVAQKRPDRFLRVLGRVAAQDPRLVGWIVGDGPLRPELERLSRELGLGKRCTFFGYQDCVGEFMGTADLFVLTSDTAGTPAVVLEAGYLGLPTVATKVGGMAECVRHGLTGVLVEQPFEAELERAILKLASDPECRRALGSQAHQWVREGFTMAPIADRYLAFYDRVLSQAAS
jgi:glycosyltransferase involved in cell wall biosynthesis